jgi:hypothetical protein
MRPQIVQFEETEEVKVVETPSVVTTSETPIGDLIERTGQAATTIRAHIPGAVLDSNRVTGYTPEMKALLTELEVQKEALKTELPEIEMLKEMPENDQRAFLTLYADLVAQLLHILARFGDRDRMKNDHMKKQYDLLNKEVGGAIGDRGSTTFWSNLFGFGVKFGSALVGGILKSDPISKLGEIVGAQIPNFTNLWTTKYEQTQSLSSNKLSMLSTEMQAISQKSGDTSGLRSEFLQFLNKVEQYYGAAVKH